MEDVIQHFSHQHPLELQAVQESQYYRCYSCGFRFSSKMYGCSKEFCVGKVYLCTLCAHLPHFIHHHPLHPKHGHTLHLENKLYFPQWCHVCNGKIPDRPFLCYDCDECFFLLHVQCAHSLRPTLRYAAHEHLLTLVHTNYERFYNTWDPWECKSCKSRLSDGIVFVRCMECKINLHIECFQSADVDGHASLPDATTKHLIQGHPHPLTLATDESMSVKNSKQRFKYFFCHACKKWDWPQRWFYKCVECNNFTSHLSCHVQFPKDMFLYTDLSSNMNNPECQGCKKPIPGGLPAYGCRDDRCKLFLDDSCLQQWRALDEQIHLLHPQHPLEFMFNHGKQLACTCCERECNGFIFHCRYCRYSEFVLDLECMLLVPISLQHQDHKHHLLVFLDKIGSYPKTSYLRCVDCKQNISFTKCLLPYTIQHQSHFHPLTLVPRLVENNGIPQFYCDACEDRRHPDECIYYCRECKFEVQIGCAKFEILNESLSKLKAVMFVTPQQIIEEEEEKGKENKKADGQHVILLKEVLLPLNEVEVEEIKNVLKLASNLTWETSLGEIPSYDDKISTKILFSDEPFKLFVSKLNSVVTLEVTHETVLSFLEEDYEVACVGEYLVPLSFEHTLEALFAKHGDFGAKCKLSPKTKQFLFLAFCRVLQSMWNTKVADVKESLLIPWWIYFAIAQAAGFEIQFAFESMKRMIYAHFGLQADKYADRKLTDTRIELRKLPQKIEELEKELQKTRERFEFLKIEENELRVASFRAKKSHLMRKCLMEAEDLECFSGGELFFPPTE